MNSIKLRIRYNKQFGFNNRYCTIFLNEAILNIIPNIHDFRSLEELKDFYHNLNSYVHNDVGPAYISDYVNHYYINGKALSEEQFKKHLHNTKFSDKLNLIID